MSVIREGCRAPQLKLVHCSVELVRNYCSLYPALNLSYCSGSAPSCVRLFEVGKSCSHVLLMLSVSVSLSVFLSRFDCFPTKVKKRFGTVCFICSASSFHVELSRFM